jgi:hypothetical protein
MKYELTTERWNLLGQPTIGGKWYFKKKDKKVWFDIVEQSWTKTGVCLKLQKIK